MTIKLSSKVPAGGGYLPTYAGTLSATPQNTTLVARALPLIKTYAPSTIAYYSAPGAATGNFQSRNATGGVLGTIPPAAVSALANNWIGLGSGMATYTDDIDKRMYMFAYDSTTNILYTGASMLDNATGAVVQLGATPALTTTLSTQAVYLHASRATEGSGNFTIAGGGSVIVVSPAGALISETVDILGNNQDGYFDGTRFINITDNASSGQTIVSGYNPTTKAFLPSFFVAGPLLFNSASSKPAHFVHMGAGKGVLSYKLSSGGAYSAFLLKSEFDAYIAQIAVKLGL